MILLEYFEWNFLPPDFYGHHMQEAEVSILWHLQHRKSDKSREKDSEERND